jgi:imidazolonepropionase
MAIVVNNGVITKIADSKELEDEYGSPQSGNKDVTIISLEGHAVVPGLVDGHNHLLWAGDRSNEITMKQQGMSYQSIAAAGGGIQHTVRETASCSKEKLTQIGYQRMRTALHNGTTHLETKSGYGLTTERELLLLEVAHELHSINHLPTMELTCLVHTTPLRT